MIKGSCSPQKNSQRSCNQAAQVDRPENRCAILHASPLQQRSVPDVYEQPLKAGIDCLPCLVGWFGTLAAGSSNADIASGYTGPRRSWIGAAAEATPS